MSGCLSAPTPSADLEETPTPTTPTTQTATVVWFPPTSTPTSLPAQDTTPTPDFRPGLGDVILTDNFSNPDPWTLVKTTSTSVALGRNELTIAIQGAKTYEFSARKEPILSDFYLEITTGPTLCRGEDEYGLLFRMVSPDDFYRFALSCEGKVRLERVLSGTAAPIQPWIQSGAVPPGAPSISHLAVWASGDELRFFIAGEYLFSVTDSKLPGGNIGLFARSNGDTAVTVNFSELIIRELEQ